MTAGGFQRGRKLSYSGSIVHALFSVESHRKSLEPVCYRARGWHKFVRRTFDCLNSIGDSFKDDITFQLRKRCSQTVMETKSKRDVGIRTSVRVELLGIVKRHGGLPTAPTRLWAVPGIVPKIPSPVSRVRDSAGRRPPRRTERDEPYHAKSYRVTPRPDGDDARTTRSVRPVDRGVSRAGSPGHRGCRNDADHPHARPDGPPKGGGGRAPTSSRSRTTRSRSSRRGRSRRPSRRARSRSGCHCTSIRWSRARGCRTSRAGGPTC